MSIRVFTASRSLKSGSPGDNNLFTGAVLACLLIVFFSCALDLFYYSGFYASDDASYLSAARRIVENGALSRKPGLGQIRLTIVGWNTLLTWIFGYNIPFIAASYILFHQALNLVTFALTRRLFDIRVGVLAMYFMAFAPLAVTYSTAVLPDIPLAFFLALSLLFFLHSYDLRPSAKTGRAYLLLFCSGLALGFAYMAKEAALVALPFYFGLWVLRAKLSGKREAFLAGAAFALGLVIILFSEWAVLSHLTGHSYIRMAWTTGADDFSGGLHEYHYGRYPLERLASLRDNFKPWFCRSRMDLVLLVAVLVYPFIRGRKLSIWFLASWFFVYHTWGSTKLTEYLPPSLQARYFTPLAPLLFAIYAFVIIKILDQLPGMVRRPERCKMLQRVVIIVLLFHPLVDLQTCDRVAGKIYAAAMVNSSTAAVKAAAVANDRPIVLSGMLSARAGPVLCRMGIDRIVMAQDCRPGNASTEKLLRDGFLYVDPYPPEKLKDHRREDGVDSLLRPLILASFETPATWSEPQRRVLGEVSIAGRPGVLRSLERFDSWYKRTEQVAHVITPLARQRPDKGAWATYLYEWTPLEHEPSACDDGKSAESE